MGPEGLHQSTGSGHEVIGLIGRVITFVKERSDGCSDLRRTPMSNKTQHTIRRLCYVSCITKSYVSITYICLYQVNLVLKLRHHLRYSGVGIDWDGVRVKSYVYE